MTGKIAPVPTDLTVSVTLNDLENHDEFVARHVGVTSEHDRKHMLSVVGFETVDDLLHAAIPQGIRNELALKLPEAASEAEVAGQLRELAGANQQLVSMIGLGYYDTITPAVIRRNVLENPAWYTAYTPYQPEISQGRLEALLNFQTMVSELTGLPVAGASLLDEATATAEAVTMMARAAKSGNTLVIDSELWPQTAAVVRTRAEPLGFNVVEHDFSAPLADVPGADDLFGVVVQYPAGNGLIRDLRPIVTSAHDLGALVTVAADLLALTLITPPGEVGADIAVGSTQRFGVPMGFGGPHAAYLSARHELARQVPGRIVGASIDADGAPAYRLSLQTREQHIRREKATSNICTAQVLLANMAAFYAMYHGPDGLVSIASRVHRFAAIIAAGLTESGLAVSDGPYFDTVVVHVPSYAAQVVALASAEGINLRLVDADHVGLSTDERTTREHVLSVWKAFELTLSDADVVRLDAQLVAAGPGLTLNLALARQSRPLNHPIFSMYHSETSMLRYLRRLADRDFALDRGMIPLGSCTMKLNAATELEAISLPGFANVHPFAPSDQASGYHAMFADLEGWLAEITGYDAVSLQPNAGSQGELAGLLAIRAYHAANGHPERDVCLIAASAHGTNAASAVMAGMRVVVVKTSPEQGEIDLADLVAKADQHAERLAAIMVTYPSTHGVFEEHITSVCEIVHGHGGQVYVDGANLNAMVGLARPGKFGADVSHLNLHKTFCIPHGGGGPGVGPVAVRAHLAPYLPADPHAQAPAVGAVSAAPWGSASILPITWAYLRMMGPRGLLEATATAILSANYIARRLHEHYPVLYVGLNGLVAHECILDLRGITKETGITVDDVAKRLIDFGFHAPTMSFPVAGTLMVEPTESEDLTELDRFIEAMICIKAEIDQVASGALPAEDNPLKNAPHTAAMLVGDWPHAYSRSEAVYPAGVDPKSKYWSPVRRIDGAYGDRNLMCTCPPIESIAEES